MTNEEEENERHAHIRWKNNPRPDDLQSDFGEKIAH